MTVRSEPRDVWLALTGRFSMRVFVDTGVLAYLEAALGERLVPVLLCDEERVSHWSERLGTRVIRRQQLAGHCAGRRGVLVDAAADQVDRALGYYSLSLRFNRRHGFLFERMSPGHELPYLNPSLLGPFPEWKVVERLAYRWTFSRRRRIPGVLGDRFRRECRALVLATVSGARVQPLMTAARRWDRPTVGYVASWDHTVGKGAIARDLDRYLVQNERMALDLVAYHRIDPARIVVTGWPQTDAFSRPRPRAAFGELLESYGLDPAHPVVLYAGNGANNFPAEGVLVQRLAEWLESAFSGGVSMVVRPHPNDAKYLERFGAVQSQSHVHLQSPSYEDLDVLTTLLQYVDCVVANAGTILLEAIVNDRPAVCVLFDERDASSGSLAALNASGSHYRSLADSHAFYDARTFEEATTAIERALAHPGERATERARAVRAVVGEVDGGAACRVAEAILEGIALHT